MTLEHPNDALSVAVTALSTAGLHQVRPVGHSEVLRVLDPPHVLACTATATPAVRDEILNGPLRGWRRL